MNTGNAAKDDPRKPRRNQPGNLLRVNECYAAYAECARSAVYPA